MRRLALIVALVAGVLVIAAPSASAHPLGNFSINHLDRLKVSSDRVDVVYILDQAEIPTFQERGLSSAQVLTRKRAEVSRRLELRVDGRVVPLAFAPGAQISYPPGQGGLKLTRGVLPLTARVAHPRVVSLRDGTFPRRVGWKAIVAQPGSGTNVHSNVAASDPTNGLRSYPKSSLSSPLDVRDAALSVKPGDGQLTAPRGDGRVATTHNRSGDGFAGVFADAAAGKGVLVFFLLAAFGWGAVHALSPGHGKAMVAACLVGTRGTPRHAVALGLIVTVTHTIGVFALGIVTLTLSAVIVPERLYPWLSLASGLLVVGVGLSVLRMRRAQNHHHDHRHEHVHPHGTGAVGAHQHVNPHGPGGPVSSRGLVAMGASAGLLPCPSALVVLLAAIAQHQVGLGLVLILAFSAGLAATLTAAGLAVVASGRALTRIGAPARLLAALPTASALMIVAVGC